MDIDLSYIRHVLQEGALEAIELVRVTVRSAPFWPGPGRFDVIDHFAREWRNIRWSHQVSCHRNALCGFQSWYLGGVFRWRIGRRRWNDAGGRTCGLTGRRGCSASPAQDRQPYHIQIEEFTLFHSSSFHSVRWTFSPVAPILWSYLQVLLLTMLFLWK